MCGLFVGLFVGWFFRIIFQLLRPVHINKITITHFKEPSARKCMNAIMMLSLTSTFVAVWRSLPMFNSHLYEAGPHNFVWTIESL